MLDWLAFVSIPNCLKFRGRKMTVIVIGRRTICWCWETGHLSSCVGKRATGHPAAESADKVKQKGNGVSFAGSEGKDEQRGLRSMKTPRTNTPTAPFHQPDSRAYNANTASHIQKLNEPNWEQIEKNWRKTFNENGIGKQSQWGCLSHLPFIIASTPMTRPSFLTPSKMTNPRKIYSISFSGHFHTCYSYSNSNTNTFTVTKKGNIKKTKKLWNDIGKNLQKSPHGLREDVCCVSVNQAEKALALAKKSKNLKCLLNFKMVNGKNVENPRNIPNTERLLTITKYLWCTADMVYAAGG